MIKQIYIELAINGFSINIIDESIYQDGTKVKTKTDRRIIIAHTKKELLDEIDKII